MEQLNDELGITSADYQIKAEGIVEEFLMTFGDAVKRASGKTPRRELNIDAKTPFTIRLNENPPSAQIIQHPKGGESAGVQRIRGKMIPPLEQFRESQIPSGIIELLPKTADIEIVKITDLTRELIIVTLDDKTILTIISQGLLRPEEVSELLKLLKKEHPEHFVVVQRYLLGIEHESRVQVPYSVVPQTDAQTFQYLNDLPSQLS